MTTNAVLAAIDVGGTTIKSALFTEELDLVESFRVSTPRAGGPDAVLGALSDVSVNLVACALDRVGVPPAALGVASLGLVNERQGVAVYSAAVGWKDVPLVEMLRRRTNMPVALGHDIRVAARAEVECGRDGGVDSLLFVAIGTGVGGALYSRPQVLAGALGRAGEIGHVSVRPNGRTCGCGARGCLEAYASASAIAADASAVVGHLVTADDVAAAVARNEGWACQVWDDAVDLLAGALVSAAVIYDPELIVVGGGLSLAGSLLVDPLQAAVAQRYPFADPPRVSAAKLGDEAALLGAALLARDLARETRGSR